MISRTAKRASQSFWSLQRGFCELASYANNRFKDSIPRREAEMKALRALQAKVSASGSAKNTAAYYEVPPAHTRN